jgi:hypothetical protein
MCQYHGGKALNKEVAMRRDDAAARRAACTLSSLGHGQPPGPAIQGTISIRVLANRRAGMPARQRYSAASLTVSPRDTGQAVQSSVNAPTSA